MKNNIIVFVIIGVIIVSAGAFVYSKKNNSDSKNYNYTENTTSASKETTNPNTPIDNKSVTTIANTYKMTDVATHNNTASCWTAVNGSVYDVTAWINKHPGGSNAIIGLCGKDGSDAFNGKHGGQKRPESELATFKIGTLN